MAIQYKSNSLSPKDFNTLRAAVGFGAAPDYQVLQSLNQGLFALTAVLDDEVIGMGRLVGDGVMYWYIQDVAVLPKYQGMGVGKEIVKRLIRYVETSSLPGTRVTIGLMSAKGKDAFYEKLGFVARPNEIYGAGMIKVFTTPDRAV